MASMFSLSFSDKVMKHLSPENQDELKKNLEKLNEYTFPGKSYKGSMSDAYTLIYHPDKILDTFGMYQQEYNLPLMDNFHEKEKWKERAAQIIGEDNFTFSAFTNRVRDFNQVFAPEYNNSFQLWYAEQFSPHGKSGGKK